jgi:hypothetical protein
MAPFGIKVLVLGCAGYDTVAGHLDAMIAERRGKEAVVRGADFLGAPGGAHRRGCVLQFITTQRRRGQATLR